MFLLVPAHPGCPRQNPKSRKTVVCVRVCVCVCVSASLPLGSEYVSSETWDDGAQRLLTLKISQRRLGGQPAVGPSAHSMESPPAIGYWRREQGS